MTSSIRLSSRHRNIKCTVLYQTLTWVGSEWNWHTHPVTNGNNVLPSSHTLQQREVNAASECKWTEAQARGESWVAWQQSDYRPLLNDSIRQLSPSAKCQDVPIPVLHRLATHAWWGMKEFVIICIMPQRWSRSQWWVQGLSCPTGSLQRKCGRIPFYSIVNKNLTFNLSEKKHMKRDYCCSIWMVSSSFVPPHNNLFACCRLFLYLNTQTLYIYCVLYGRELLTVMIQFKYQTNTSEKKPISLISS